MDKLKYSSVKVSCASLEGRDMILGGSIISTNATVIIPRGQKVDEYDFSSVEFVQEWDIQPPV